MADCHSWNTPSGPLMSITYFPTLYLNCFMYKENTKTRIDTVMHSSPICLKLNKFLCLFIVLTIHRSEVSVRMQQEARFLRALCRSILPVQLLQGSSERSVLAKPLLYRSRICVLWLSGISGHRGSQKVQHYDTKQFFSSPNPIGIEPTF